MIARVYTSSSCPYCKKVVRFLKKHGVKFKEINISKHRTAAKELERITGQTGVPVVLTGSYKIIGFNESKIRKVFKIRGKEEV